MPGRKSNIQIAERTTEFYISGRSGHHDKVIPVPNYTIPQTMSEPDSISRTITRKGMQDFRREIPTYADPFYRHPSKPTEVPTQLIPREILDSDIDTLGQDINRDFKENSTLQV